jgi:bacteriocin-like protein
MDFYSLTHFSGESTKMANIEINDLKPAGAELFSDSEGFMNELSDSELANINGGYAADYTDTHAYTCNGRGCPELQAYNGNGQLQLEALP